MTRRVTAIPRLITSPKLGLAGQGLRFAIAGGIVSCVYVLATLALSHVAGLSFQAALALAFILAVTTHFTLQRAFVWTRKGEFALPVERQLGRYAAIAIVQYGLTAGVTSTVPGVLGLPTDVVYLATAACVTAGNFALLRSLVFHGA